MKRILNKLGRGEKGQALIIVLILMLVGGLIIAPVLAYVGTGLKVGKEVHEERMMELYAADAGVEDALWQIKQPTPDPSKVPSTVGQSLTYPLSSTVNGKTMGVTIYWISGDIGAGTYKVTSVATSADGSNTTIESYIQTLPLFWTKAATSCSTINLQPGSVINGDVAGIVDPDQEDQFNGDIDPPLTEDEWPFSVADVLSNLYEPQSGYPDPTKKFTNPIDIATQPDIGPGWSNGNLEIKNTGVAGAEAKLTGTVFVKGPNSTLEIGKTAVGKTFTLDLNYNTIYVEGTKSKYAIDIGGACTIKGSGCIIAVGGINFQPNISSNPDDFVFVMSVSDEVNFHPSGDFYGSLAGKLKVNLQPGYTFTWNPPPTDSEGNIMLNFPTEGVASDVMIRTWEIKLN